MTRFMRTGFRSTLCAYLQSRSLLDLPAKANGSTHSLDLPAHDQPRRASAPEGENIRIVIDDVDATGQPLPAADQTLTF